MPSISPSLANNKIGLTLYHPENYEEGVASETIYPGMLISLVGTVGSTMLKYSVMTWPGGNPIEVMFATENIYQGKSLTEPYAADSRIMFRYPQKGEVFLTKIEELPGSSTINVGQFFRPNENGWLREFLDFETNYPDPIAVSLEKDLTPSLPRWTAVRIL